MIPEGSPSSAERHRTAAAALAQAERIAREASSGRTSRDSTAGRPDRAEPDPRDVRGRKQGARTRRRPAADAGPDGQPGPDADPQSVARDIVLRKLTAQQRSRSELAKALKERDVPDDAAGEVLDRMEDVGLVDDTAFAESWVRSRQSRRGLSRRALRQELVQKGIDRDDIDDALSAVTPEDEVAAATALARKKLRAMAGLEREVKYRRLAGALARRGFSAGLTSQVLATVLDE
jgi:regulatory protein